MKISYSLRAFAIYFVILGSLIWFTLDNAVERLNDGMRQSAESVLVDLAQILAASIEDDLRKSGLGAKPDSLSAAPAQLVRIFTSVSARSLQAKIYQVIKTQVDTQAYVTDSKGKVIYHSAAYDIGADYSKWRDVSLTLEGKYGARTSYVYADRIEPDDPKAMIIAAPIVLNNSIVGVVSVLKPINSLEGHLLTETKQLRRYAFLLLGLALLLGFLLSLWFTRSLNRIADYANRMADGQRIDAPVSRDSRLSELTQSISNLRSQLDGKEYVENYIHSLTHELKTPLTSIRGAVELLSENMPREARIQFLENINTSNQRMSRLVERMLSLAQLESRTQLISSSEFDLSATISRLIDERSPTISARGIELNFKREENQFFSGDKILISQAVANLLDNAINYCKLNGSISVELSVHMRDFQVLVFNQGQAIPEFAKAKLFDRFFSLPRPDDNTQMSKSTGLGLSFVREIMKLHKGSVQVDNYQDGVAAVLSWPRSEL